VKDRAFPFNLHRKPSELEGKPASAGTSDLINPLEDYILGERLGQGSFAIVRKAVSKASGLPVAIKTYEKGRLLGELRKRNVQQESTVLAALNHTNIVQLQHTIETATHIHLILDYIEGLSLHNLLQQQERKRLEEWEARAIFTQMMLGVCYLHEKGVVHRDLKLQNVLLDRKKQVKIIDFGFAMQGNAGIRLHCGTPSYISPEIAERREYQGAPADIWAAGVLLYAILCGEFPFKGLNDRELYQRIGAGSFAVPLHLSAQAKELISAMLSVDPLIRPIARVVLTHPWVTGVGKSTSQTVLFRPITSQNPAKGTNPLDNYDKRVLTRLRNLGYSDLILIRELKTANSHVLTLYTHLLVVKSPN
jgi:MAP/microtubule affinity-regulating kinase